MTPEAPEPLPLMTLVNRARLRTAGDTAAYLAGLLTAQAGRGGPPLDAAVAELRELASLLAGTADILMPATRESTRFPRQATPHGDLLS